MSLTSRILIGMLAGVLFGFLVQWSGVASDHWVRAFLVDGLLDAGGQIFMRSLQLLVVPLVFISLVFGSFCRIHLEYGQYSPVIEMGLVR